MRARWLLAQVVWGRGKEANWSKTERGLCPFQMPQTANNGVKLRQSVIAAGALSDRLRISSRHFSETLDPALQSLIKNKLASLLLAVIYDQAQPTRPLPLLL